MPKEIERKWLCEGYLSPKVFPELAHVATYVNYTSYLFVSEGIEIRVREKNLAGKSTATYRIGIKVGNGMVRDEFEEDIPSTVFRQLRIACHNQPIKDDTREYLFVDKLGNDCRLFISHTDENFFRAEIEFPNEESAEAFDCPFGSWEEITDEPRYAMKNYWDNTRIKGEVYNGK